MRPTLTREQRHKQILETARLLFQQRGYDHVTISDVITESQIARGTFYLHFDSLEAILSTLFDEVLLETWRRIHPILSDLTTSFQECTVEVIHAVFQMFQTDPLMARVFYSGGGESFLRKKHEAMFGKLGGLLTDALRRRHGDSIPNADWVVAMLIALVGDMSYYELVYVTDSDRGLFELKVTDFVLAGLRNALGDLLPASNVEPDTREDAKDLRE